MFRLKTLSRRTLSGSWRSWRTGSESLLDFPAEGEPNSAVDDEPGFVSEVLRTGAWRVVPLLALTGVGFAAILPELPTACTSAFSGGRDCASRPSPSDGDACADAAAACIQYQSWWLLLNHSVIAFFLAPLFGKASDRIGRKPFLVLGALCSALPCWAVLGMTSRVFDFKAAFPIISFGASLGSFSPALAYVSDCVSERHRTQTIGLLMGTLLFGVIFGPHLTRLGTSRDHALAASAILAIAVVYSLTIPESLPPQKREVSISPAKGRIQRTRSLKQIASLGRSRLFVVLASIAFIGSITSEGSQEIGGQFLILVAGFTPRDQANLITSIGLSGMLAQFILLPLLSRVVKREHEHLLIFGTNLAMAAVNVAICFCSENKAVAIALQSLSWLSLISFSISAGILSRATSSRHQGLVSGVISAIRSQAYGCGPVLYSQLFRWIPYLPGFPYLFSAAMMVASAALALCLGGAHHEIEVAGDEEEEEENALLVG